MLQRLLLHKHLEDDEALLVAVHKHWLVGLSNLCWPTVFIAVCAFILSINPARGMITVMSVLFVVLAIWWLRNFFDYYLDAWLVTDQGIIDIAWHGWFHRQSTRTLYSDLQGISYEIKGVWGTLLRYGVISIEKISTGESISLEYVPRPKRVETIVLRSQEAYLHTKNMKDSKQIQELLASFVAGKIQLGDFASIESDDDSSDNDDE